jgi:hypothetical protein
VAVRAATAETRMGGISAHAKLTWLPDGAACDQGARP